MQSTWDRRISIQQHLGVPCRTRSAAWAPTTRRPWCAAPASATCATYFPDAACVNWMCSTLWFAAMLPCHAQHTEAERSNTIFRGVIPTRTARPPQKAVEAFTGTTPAHLSTALPLAEGRWSAQTGEPIQGFYRVTGQKRPNDKNLVVILITLEKPRDPALSARHAARSRLNHRPYRCGEGGNKPLIPMKRGCKSQLR